MRVGPLLQGHVVRREGDAYWRSGDLKGSMGICRALWEEAGAGKQLELQPEQEDPGSSWTP